jgi:tetratricopeptide (TPR) repeat protein
LDEALAHFQKAIEINPDFADAQVELTRTLAAQGKKEGGRGKASSTSSATAQITE